MKDNGKMSTGVSGQMSFFDNLPEKKVGQTKKSDEIKKEPATELMKEVARRVPVKRKIQKDFSEEEAKEILEQVSVRAVEDSESEEAKRYKERREKIIRIKKNARELERGNNSKLIIFPSFSRKSDELTWYKMGNFSADYYSFRVMTRIGKVPRPPVVDTDRFAKMRAVVSVRDIEKLVESIMKLQEFDRFEVTEDGIYVLYMKRPLSDDEVGALRRTVEERHVMLHNVLKPRKANADVYQAVLMINRQMLPRVANLESGYSRTVGDAMGRALHRLFSRYFDYADGRLDVKTTRDEMLAEINILLTGLGMLDEINAMGFDALVSIGENVVALKNLIGELK